MRARQPPLPHPLPRLWLMTDERVGDGLWPALARLPRGAGVVFRHLATGAAQRQALLARVRKAARRRGLTVLVAGADYGVPRAGCAAASVHDLRELGAARRAGARLVFLSPIFPTRTHPGARTLGPMRFAALARRAHAPVIALGGMTARRFPWVRPLGADGWAAIDGLASPPSSFPRKRESNCPL